MNSISPFATYIIITVGIALLLNIAFLLNYGLRSKWRSTSGGKLFFYAFCLSTVLLALIEATYVFEDYPLREVVRLVTYTLFGVNAIGANVVLLRRQRESTQAVVAFMRTVDESLSKKSDAELNAMVKDMRAQYRADPEGFKNGSSISSDK